MMDKNKIIQLLTVNYNVALQMHAESVPSKVSNSKIRRLCFLPFAEV